MYLNLSVKAELGIGDSLGYLFQHLVPKLPESISHVGTLLLHDLFQERGQLRECRIIFVVEPTLNKDSVIWLQLEVLSHVVYNYCL